MLIAVTFDMLHLKLNIFKMKNKINMMIAVAGITCGMPVSAALTSGQSVLLDFGNQNFVAGTAPTANSNLIGGSAARTELTEFTSGTTVNVGLIQSTATGNGGFFFNADPGDLGSPNGNVGTTGASIPSPFNSAIVEDWGGVASSNGYVITLTGLNNNLTYDLDYALGGFTANSGVDNLILSSGTSSTNIGLVDVAPVFASLNGLTTDGAGNLAITISGDVAAVSGLSITAVPEPTSAALLGLSSLAFMLRRRR